ncbi:hypothetical protein [Kosakonia sp. SMBL-WEM22]|nr:hypothetical protein [Kosakonia sp. SMBL-WEM22]
MYSPFDHVTQSDNRSAANQAFGFEEMLTELEVIVEEAVVRLAEEEEAA